MTGFAGQCYPAGGDGPCPVRGAAPQPDARATPIMPRRCRHAARTRGFDGWGQISACMDRSITYRRYVSGVTAGAAGLVFKPLDGEELTAATMPRTGRWSMRRWRSHKMRARTQAMPRRRGALWSSSGMREVIPGQPMTG